MPSERSVIELAREMSRYAAGETADITVTIDDITAICASLIEHHEALGPFVSLGELFLNESSWSDSDDVRITSDFDIRLDERQVGDFRRAASVHTKAQEPL